MVQVRRRSCGAPPLTPILPDQDRDFAKAAEAACRSATAHDQFGGWLVSAFTNFGYQIITRINGVRMGDLPATFRFNQTGTGRDQSFFGQDTWHHGGLTVNAGLRLTTISWWRRNRSPLGIAWRRSEAG
jgi:hypothetical protein